MKSVEIIIAAHKAYDFPKDKSYVPLQVGAEISNTDLKIARDDTGDNISSKNPYFCELTGLYWLWKNYPGQENIGICHYRRFFVNSEKKMKMN